MSKTLKRIVVALITLLTILGISIKVSADDTSGPFITNTDSTKVFQRDSFGDKSNVWLPQRSIDGSTGLLPQYWKSISDARRVTLDNSRLSLSTKDWTATINGDTVYCA